MSRLNLHLLESFNNGYLMAKFVREAKDSFDSFISYFNKNDIDLLKYFLPSGSVHNGYVVPFNVINYSNEGATSLDQ